MSTKKLHLLHSWRRIILASLLLFRARSFGLNNDGLLLLSFKFSITNDPYGVLQTWNYNDESPCSWNGVSCETPFSGGAAAAAAADFWVTSLSLPNCGLSGSIPATIGMLENLRSINLSNNSLNGSIPFSIFGAFELRVLDFSDNLLAGGLPELVGNLQNLRVLNLSGNSLVGNLPVNLALLRNLTDVSLKSNYFSGSIPGGFNSVRVLDLSSNLINGTLPPDFGGVNLEYLNVSFNRLAGEIPPEFASKIPTNATVDLSFNNLTGQIPATDLFANQQTTSYSGNPELCGEPLTNPCPVHSSVATPPNATATNSPPAIAVIPTTTPPPQGKRSTGLRTGAILGIVAGDIAGLGILSLVFVYVYWTCLKRQRHVADDEESTTSESTNSDEKHKPQEQKSGALVTMDGEKELELETLLKASAYILGASGSSIMYKTVLEDGTALAVRRIGENGADRFRDFQNRVRVIAKLVHPNLIRIRGFYWGNEEKLIIYDFVPNGSLANCRNRKAGGTSSPCHLTWEMRLKIAKGVARGLCYIHEKKHVHGNLKPTNILLGLDMEPKIGDFGLERLMTGDHSSKAGGSTRYFGSKRSTASHESFHDYSTGSTQSALCISPYHAPESLRSLRPSPKWDVFSFGVVFLELLTGKVIVSDEAGPASAVGSSTSEDDEDRGKVLRMADVSIRAEVEGNEDALLAMLKLGYGCVSHVPQKRPSMKEVFQELERFPSSPYCFGH
ncbi:hypothetical protein ABFS82_12G017600 [Erythranthe guttata]